MGCRSLGPLFLPFAFLCLLFRFLFVYFLCMSWNLCSWVPCLIYLLFTDQKKIDHLLIHCKSAKMLWHLFLSICGTSWVFSKSVLHTLLAWQGADVGKKRKRIWLAAPLCLFWTLWRARNRIVFENKGSNDQKIKAKFVTNLWAWANMLREEKTNSIVDFLTWLGSR